MNSNEYKQTNRNKLTFSTWGKWDLHIHTPYACLNNQYGKTSDDDFITTIVKNNYSAVGITNYFRFNKKEAYDNDSLKNLLQKEGIAVFLNLEFRLSEINKNDELCDYHIIFSPTVIKADIDKLESHLTVHIDGEEKLLQDLTQNDLSSKKLYVSFYEIQNIINDKNLGLRNVCFTGFLSRGHGESRSANLIKEIEKKSDFIIHSSNSQEKINQDYEYWTYENNKAIFQGSDAHSLKQIGTKYTWVKAKPTFEGLRQVLLNPHHRINFPPLNPENLNNAKGYINQITFGNDDYKTEISMSPGLNTIIGIRGQGKSILLKAIAHANKERNLEKSIHGNTSYSEMEKLEKEEKFIDQYFPALLSHSNTTNNEKLQLTYIQQGFIGNLIYENNPERDTENYIFHLLNNDYIFQKAYMEVEKFKTDYQSKINMLIGKLVELNIEEENLKNFQTNNDLNRLKLLLNNLIIRLSKDMNIDEKELQQLITRVYTDKNKTNNLIQQNERPPRPKGRGIGEVSFSLSRIAGLELVFHSASLDCVHN